ncbi:mechanosensitive ion channel family protein [Almyronema epifaneia]|uniref:Mechanosensitive ion channel family protein n=1 Tax=Almyronema epifaneia S1 TaxID=2991925 RepID=A0ABW6IGN9_9CYAN
MKRQRFWIWLISFSLLFFALPGLAQESLIDINLPTRNQVEDAAIQIEVACVRLDGYCPFRVAAPRSDLAGRVRAIEAVLQQVRDRYVQASTPSLQTEVRVQPEGAPPDANAASEPLGRKAPEIYLGVGSEPLVRLMSVTQLDAELRGADMATAADMILQRIAESLERSRWERQPPYLTRQITLAVLIGLSLLIFCWVLNHWEKQLRQQKAALAGTQFSLSLPLLTWLNQRQQWNFTEAQLRCFQLIQLGLAASGLLLILSRFPQTRIVQVRTVESLEIPFKVGIVALATYVAIRLSYALISRLSSAIAREDDLSPEINRRLRLRINTISRVIRGVVTLSCIAIGSLLALSVIGINTVPLIAGASIIGVALSLAAQDLIKDTFNGFFIILEDQYAVGDVVTIQGIRGLVENMNLRITQLRDEAGCLVSIPNSEIRLIANHSSHWSRADLFIPVGYHTNVDQMLALIQSVAHSMSQDPQWQEAILAQPEVLGVEAFDERGLMIRVWIKTQPLKQWVVAREFRRRLKGALDKANIEIPAHIDFKPNR